MKVGALLAVYEHAKLAPMRRGQVTRRALDQALGGLVDRDVRDLAVEDIAPVIEEIATDAPVNANRILAYLNAFFGWAVTAGHLKTNPLNRFPRLAKETPRRRTLNPDELAAVWRASSRLGYPFGPIMRLLILTATRREEVAGMRLSALTLDPQSGGLVWTVRAADDPGGPFEILLTPLAKSELDVALAHRKPGSDLIFSTTGTTPVSG